MNTKRNQAIVRALLVLGILIVVNVISVRLFDRLDLTKQKVYTLSVQARPLFRRQGHRSGIFYRKTFRRRKTTIDAKCWTS